MASPLGRLPYSSVRRINSRGVIGDSLHSLRCQVSKPWEVSYEISRQYWVGRQHEKATRKSMTTQSDGSCSYELQKRLYEPEERSSEPYYKPLPKIKTNLKLTANILLKNARDGFSSHNIVCSPLSLNFVMNMVAVGSKGDTLRQLLSFIGSSSLEDVNIMSSRIMEVASQTSSGGPDISFANGVWVNKKFPLKPSYKEVISNTYKAEVKNVDMKQAVEEVNSWVDKKTKGLIKDILSHGSLDDTTMVILGNALYFKGVWSKEFDTRTQHRDFHLLCGKTVSVPFMTSSKNYFYGAFDGFKVLKIPYQRGSDTRQFSMYFFLPNEIDGLQNILEKINSNPELLHLEFALREVTLDNFWIPKFKFLYEFDPKREMQHLGLTLPFDYNCKDITEMVHTAPEDKVYISKVIHKAVIDVDEKGTEAAAVTIRRLRRTCSLRTYVERYEFVADHPFLFMIREEMTGAILFVGTVVNPLKN